MVFRVELAPAAVDDLDRIAVYIRERGSFESADRWFRGIIAETRSLQEMPRRCPISEESTALGAEVHVLFFGKRKSPVQDLFFDSRFDSNRSSGSRPALGNDSGCGR